MSTTKKHDWSAVIDRLGGDKGRVETKAVSDVAVKPKASPRASKAGEKVKKEKKKDSLTLQKENNCLSMLLAGHYGTETGDNTADVVWGKEVFELIINRKKLNE